MFVGHFAVAFGAKRYAPSVSLGALFLACQLADLLWPNLVLLGVETVAIEPGSTALTPLRFVSYPYSHSLLALAIWAILFAAIYRVARRSTVSTVLVIIGVVLSHWLLDFVTHRPDMPLVPGSAIRLGLGLWNAPVAAVLVELLLFAAGVGLYVATTRAADRIGSIGLWTLVAFLLIAYVANIFGPPPPSVAVLAWSAQSIWLLVAWAYWVDRHRLAVGNGRAASERG